VAGYLKMAALAVVAVVVVGCRDQATAIGKIPQFTAAAATNAFKETEEFVALGSRAAGSEGARLAAQYLCDRIEALVGEGARIESFEDDTPYGVRTFHNVIVELAAAHASAPRIVLLSHFDTKRDIPGETAENPFVGANDSGSSTGLLLSLAELFSSSGEGLACHVMFAFLDGEECAIGYSDRDGLHGSRHLAAKLRREGVAIKAVILADMIGDSDLHLEIPRNSTPELRLLALKCAERLELRDKVSLGRGFVLDDHQPFLDVGYAAIDLIDFKFGSAPGLNDYWHTMEDTMDKLSVESFEVTGRLITAMMAELVETGRD